jgi:MarR family transcriptional regulator, organic hydroperoxide resistance regulator
MNQPRSETTVESIDRIIADICHLHFSRHLQRFEALGLYRGQSFVLRILWDQEGITQVKLAEYLDIKPATMTKMLQRMEKAGFIARKPDPADQRLSRVYLTDQGRTLQLQIENMFEAMALEVVDGISTQDQVELRRLLHQVRFNLQHAIDVYPQPPHPGKRKNL